MYKAHRSLSKFGRRESIMKCTSMKLRAFNIGGAFEIVLPNGKVVLIDPCFSYYKPDKSYTGVFEGGYTREDVTGADYVILSHSHWDHDIDLKYFVEKFNPKVFCSAFCAEEILKYHNIPYDNLIPMYPNSRYTLDDFTLENGMLTQTMKLKRQAVMDKYGDLLNRLYQE